MLIAGGNRWALSWHRGTDAVAYAGIEGVRDYHGCQLWIFAFDFSIAFEWVWRRSMLGTRKRYTVCQFERW